MELIKDRDTGIYKVRFTGANGPVERSTKTTNRADAEEVVKQSRLHELELASKAKALTAESLQAIMAGRKVSCETALAEWAEWRATDAKANTLRTQTIILKHFFTVTSCAKWPVTRITTDHIDTFINGPGESGVSNRNIRHATIRNFFKFCSARAYCIGNPASLTRVKLGKLTHEQKESKPRVPFTSAEFKHIIAHTEGFWQAAVALSYWTGLRLSDIACLEWASITDAEIIVHTQKRDARVALPFSDPLIGGGELSRVLMGMMMEGDTRQPYCFPVQRICILDPEKRALLSVQFGRLMTELGIEGKTFHCLRHSFVTRLSKSGKTLEDIGRLVGHASTSTTEVYRHE
jgi:integrase